MRVAEKIVRDALDENVVLYLSEGRLAYVAEVGDISQELHARILQHKDEVIAFLDQAGGETIAPADRGSPLPLSFAQQRIWFVDQLEGGSRQYNVLNVLRLTGPLDRLALQRVFDTLLERHEVFRTTYSGKLGLPQQIVHAATALDIHRVSLLEIGANEQQRRIRGLIKHESDHGFDLSRDLMLRVTLVQCLADDHVLIISMHHIVTDGWSIAIMIREFCALYRAYSAGQENPLPPLTIQYADFAAWQRQNLTDDRLNEQLRYWTDLLRGAPALHGLPLDRPRPVRASFAGSSYQLRLPRDVLEGLTSLAGRNDATLFMVVLGAYALLLARWSGRNDIVVACPIAGRTQSQVEPLIGIFLNSLVYRFEIDLDSSFESLLAAARKHALDAYANQDLPFEMLVDQLQPRRSLSHSALFQLMFTLQNNEQVELTLPGLSVGTVGTAQEIVKFDLVFEAGADNDGLWLHWSYARDLFDESAIAGLANGFGLLLRAIAVDACRPVGEIALVQQTDAGDEFADTADAEDRPSPGLNESFQRSRLGFPDAIAVAHGERKLTFAALDKQAECLARCLMHSGGTAGTIVAIYLSDPLQRIVAQLAALKSGMASLTVEPPMGIDQAMLAAQIGLVVTQTDLWPECLELSIPLIDIDGFETEYRRFEDFAVSPLLPAKNSTAFVVAAKAPGEPIRWVSHSHAEAELQFSLWREIQQPSEGALVLLLPGISAFAPLEWLFVLLSGMSLYLPEPSECADVECLADTIEARGVRRLTLPAPFLSRLPAPRPGYRLDCVTAFGARISEATAGLWADGRRLVCFDGPDPLPYAYYAEIEPGSPLRMQAAGRRVALAVRDSAGRPLPAGAVGELFVLLPTQHSDANGRPDRRRLRTGLSARQFHDGHVESFGLLADRGLVDEFGVPLHAIEQQLACCGGLADVILLIRQQSDAPTRMIAYAVLLPSTRDVEEQLLEIYASVKRALPDYLLPDQFFVADGLPVDTRGRVDRARAMAQVEFWSAGLEPLLCAPTFRPDVDGGLAVSARFEGFRSDSAAADSRSVVALPDAVGATEPVVLLALFALALSLHAGTEEICLAAALEDPSDGGAFPMTSSSQLLPILMQAGDDTPLASVIGQVSLAVARSRYLSLPRGAASKNAIVSANSQESGAWRDVAVVYRSGAYSSIGAAAARDEQTRLLLEAEHVEGHLAWQWRYDTASYREETVSKLDSCLRSLLRWTAEDPSLTKIEVKRRMLETAKASLAKMKNRFAARQN